MFDKLSLNVIIKSRCKHQHDKFSSLFRDNRHRFIFTRKNRNKQKEIEDAISVNSGLDRKKDRHKNKALCSSK